MAFERQKYSEKELLSIRKKDYLSMVFPSILKSLSIPREGTGKEVSKEEVLEWFEWMYKEAEKKAVKDTYGETNGLIHDGEFTPLSEEIIREIITSKQPF